MYVHTFSEINDERIWARGHVDPFPRQVLHLQAGMIRCLEQLFVSSVSIIPNHCTHMIMSGPKPIMHNRGTMGQ